MRLKRNIVGILATFMVICLVQCAPVKAAECMPMFLETSQCTVSLLFNNNKATCSVHVYGKTGTTSISGKLKLYDVTDSKAVKTWSISGTGNSCGGSKTATVKSGHTYRLKFTGTVTGSSGNSESITKKVKKTN